MSFSNSAKNLWIISIWTLSSGWEFHNTFNWASSLDSYPLTLPANFLYSISFSPIVDPTATPKSSVSAT